jgi:hypothetical protein
MTYQGWLTRNIGWILLTACSALACAKQPTENPAETTICLISANPVHFDGKKVVVHAQLNSDGIERVVLTDNTCGNDGIAIERPQHFKGEAEYTNALSQGYRGTLDKVIQGIFVGRFSWRPKSARKRVLELREVQDISVEMLNPKSDPGKVGGPLHESGHADPPKPQ